MPAGTVEVFLIGASGIKDTERFGGKADPYAVLTCGKQKLRSNTAANQGSKPQWNQKFSFYIDDSATELKIVILNQNTFTEDDEIGSTTIPLAKVFAESKLPTTSYNVVRPSGRVQGEIKLSISFTPKKKPGVPGTTNSSIPGPYSPRTHSSPYVALTEPEPKHKHDPLKGPYGYYKKPTSGSTTSEPTKIPYGSGVGAWVNSSTGGSSHSSSPSSEGSLRPPYGARTNNSNESSRPGYGGIANNDSNQAGRMPYSQPVVSDLYPPSIYPPTGGSVNPDQLSSYPGSESTPSYSSTDSYPSSTNGSSHGPVYPHMYAPSAPTEYDATGYPQSPYDHVPHTSVPPHYPDVSEHGGMPRPPPSKYPSIGAHNSSYSAAPNQKPNHSSISEYQLDEVTTSVAGLGLSGHSNNGNLHGGYRPPGVIPPPSAYPGEPLHANYSGYNDRPASDYSGGYPPVGSSHGKPPASEYPHSSGYPPAGYPSSSDGSSHGQYGAPPPPGPYPPPYSMGSSHGPPSSSYYPPQAGYPYPGQPLGDSYPPVPFYNPPPTHYLPAGYPK